MSADHREWLDRQCVLPTPDRRRIWEWAHDAIRELPAAYAIRGRFNVNNSPWLREPFDSCQDSRIRRTTVLKAVQSGGTLLAEIVAAWRMANDPGPSTFTLQSAEMASIEGKTRLFPLFESVPQIARVLPRPGPMRTQTEVFFPGGSFFILNSANLSHQQSQSVRWKYNDECWLPQWADVYEDACRRVTAFEQQGTSHILDISQGGTDGAESRPCWATWSFRQGSMEEWSATCIKCEKVVPLHFHQKMIGDETRRAGVVWSPKAKREDGTYDEQLAADSARFVCCHCGHEHADNDATRAHWKKTGRYVESRKDAPKDWRSFHWEALPAHSMRLLVLEYCQAENFFHQTGDDSSRRKFKQKREARPWLMEKKTVNLFVKDSGYKLADHADGQPIPDEAIRFLAIDRQQDHWWCEVGAFSTAQGPRYRQLWFGRVDTRDQLRQLQQRYKVADACVAQDRGYRPADVDRDCAEFGWRSMRGYGRRTWTMRDEASGQMINFPFSDPQVSDYRGGDVYFYNWSGDYFKDLLAAALEGKGDLRWEMPSDVNPLYIEHLKGEHKVEVRTGVWEWREVRSNAPNHGLDTSAMLLCMATIAGIIRFVPAKT